jgi:hypothetical protein
MSDNMNNSTRSSEQSLTFYQSLVPGEGEIRFVTFKTRNGKVFDIPVRASGKKAARKAAQSIVESGELCGGLRFVEVS